MYLPIGNGFIVFVFLTCTVPIALLGAIVSWAIARRLASHPDLRVWVGIWATLPEVAMVSSGWLEFGQGVALFVVLGASLVGAMQCARAEWRYASGGPRETRWRLAPHVPVLASILVFVSMGWSGELQLAIFMAAVWGAGAVWGMWPMRPVRTLDPGNE
jgi:hypothetical protein